MPAHEMDVFECELWYVTQADERCLIKVDAGEREKTHKILKISYLGFSTMCLVMTIIVYKGSHEQKHTKGEN